MSYLKNYFNNNFDDNYEFIKKMRFFDTKLKLSNYINKFVINVKCMLLLLPNYILFIKIFYVNFSYFKVY